MGALAGWKLCPRCGSALENELSHASCASCGFVAYANSAPAVQALVVREGRVLLARRDRDPGIGKWDLPGGFLEEGEEPLAGLRRELREETGLEVEPVVFLGAFVEPYLDRFVLGLTWHAVATGDATAADDVAEVRWFAAEELPARGCLRIPAPSRAPTRLGRRKWVPSTPKLSRSAHFHSFEPRRSSGQ